MSLSTKTEQTTKSPVARYYNWSGSEGKVSYWNKETSEKVYVENLTFILIDIKNCVEGFSDKHQNGFRSNEVKSTQKEELVIKWNNTGKVLLKGLYGSIKNDIKANGGNYNISLYGVEEIDGEFRIINIKLKGSGLSAWLEFDKSSKINKEGLTIRVGKSDLKKKGAVKYYEPVFLASPTVTKQHEVAVSLDTELQEYFTNRTAWVTDEPTEEERKQLRAPSASTGTGIYNSEMVETTVEDFLSDDEAEDELFNDL